jgi:hypothetical protein
MMPNGIPVRTLRDAWEKACTDAGVGLVCVDCATPVQAGAPCIKCSGKRTRYTGLIFHDLRRTAARNLRRARISETVIMKIGGWRTRSVFERYALVSRGDIVDAIRKLQINRQESQISHEIGHGAQPDQIGAPPKSVN